MKTHVCLVSAQAAANLLPALDDEIKPQSALLVVSNAMEKKAEDLKAVFRETGIEVKTLPLSDEHNFSAIEDELMAWALDNEERETILNLTGGTKLMALAAQSVAKAAGWKMFYVDVDTDEISWLEESRHKHKLAEKLRLRHYLQSYGFTLPEKPAAARSTPEQQELAKTLINQIGSLESALSQLNWLTQYAEDKGSLQVDMNSRQQDSRSLETLLRDFEQAGQLSVEGKTIRFNDEKLRSFAKGGWLETHVFDVLTRLDGIRDKAAGLDVVHSDTGTKNELDTAFLAHNRLFVIECKTARMDRPEAPKANDALFKLAENCQRMGGTGARGMLVSYRGLNDAEKNLARALRIELVCGRDIQRLEEKLKNWVN